MVLQDLTKFTLVIMLLGITLALAVFRPQILPTEFVQPTSQPIQVEESSSTPGLGEGGPPLLENWSSSEGELNQRERELDQREAKLNRREARLNQCQVELDEREAKLEEQKAALQAWEERLIEHNDLLGKEQVRLQKKRVSLAEWEQEPEGRMRLSVAAVIISSLMAIPSVLVLVALMWQSQRRPGEEAQRGQAPKTRRQERFTRHGGPTPVARVPIHGDNEQSNERTRYLRYSEAAVQERQILDSGTLDLASPRTQDRMTSPSGVTCTWPIVAHGPFA